MKSPNFKVLVSDFTSSVDEWRHAQQVPKSQLPKLNDEQREVARKFKISEEEYARGVLAGLLGQKRQEARAQNLGEVIQRMLEGSTRHERVIAVIADMFKGRWIVQIQTPKAAINVAVPRELADDVLDWGLREQMEELRARLLYALGRDGRAVKRQQ